MYLRKYGTICGFKISVTMSKKDKEYDEDGLVIRPNKTALKKEREEVKAFAEKLLALPKDNYALLPIDEILKNALLEGKRLKDNPLRRHLAFVVRLIVSKILQPFKKVTIKFVTLIATIKTKSTKSKPIVNVLLTMMRAFMMNYWKSLAI